MLGMNQPKNMNKLLDKTAAVIGLVLHNSELGGQLLEVESALIPQTRVMGTHCCCCFCCFGLTSVVRPQSRRQPYTLTCEDALS